MRQVQAIERAAASGEQRNDGLIMAVSSAAVGSILEAYDFVLFAALVPLFRVKFFSSLSPTLGFIIVLVTFAVGFVIRPIGSLIFGRLGDVIGRKNVLLICLLMMGAATTCMGLLPTYDSIGLAAPLLLVTLRAVQGLAIGGEFGSAVVLLAEYAPAKSRGAYTGLTQIAATLAFIFAILIILACQQALGPAYLEWGWRLPLLFSFFLLLAGLWIRLNVKESPVFVALKRNKETSSAPLSEALLQWKNLKLVLTGLFAITSGQAVIFFSAQYYSLFFLTQVSRLDSEAANQLVLVALIVTLPSFVFFGWLSDRIGRKPILLSGFIIGAIMIFPLFHMLNEAVNPAMHAAAEQNPVVVVANPSDCNFTFDPMGAKDAASDCDIATRHLANAGVPYRKEIAAQPSNVSVRIGNSIVSARDTAGLDRAIAAANYPARADRSKVSWFAAEMVLIALNVIAGMVYGPSSVALVELFPARIRNTSLSVVYNVGNGWIGGLMPATATTMVMWSGNPYYGLWYPVVIAGTCIVVNVFTLKDGRGINING